MYRNVIKISVIFIFLFKKKDWSRIKHGKTKNIPVCYQLNIPPSHIFYKRKSYSKRNKVWSKFVWPIFDNIAQTKEKFVFVWKSFRKDIDIYILIVKMILMISFFFGFPFNFIAFPIYSRIVTKRSQKLRKKYSVYWYLYEFMNSEVSMLFKKCFKIINTPPPPCKLWKMCIYTL